ncbi:MAG: hypothetical protein K6F09_07810 [Clostridiales bacterium]|nr:hypothetical protein [Clostridiales bacterium]
MACFLVPAAEAVVTTVIKKKTDGEKEIKSPFVKRLGWLNNMLWGGSALLAFEHVWHGEVTPWFPFLTAASNPADAAEMLTEMATSGVGMSLLVTAAWVGVVAVSNNILKRSEPDGKRLPGGTETVK